MELFVRAIEAIEKLAAVMEKMTEEGMLPKAETQEKKKEKPKTTAKKETAKAEEKPPKAEEKKEDKKEEKKEEEVKEDTVSVEEVRAKTNEFIQAGAPKKEVKAILTAHGWGAIAEIPEEDRAAFLSEVEALAEQL